MCINSYKIDAKSVLKAMTLQDLQIRHYYYYYYYYYY